MRIALMSYVEYDLIFGCVENVMKSDDSLDYDEATRKMNSAIYNSFKNNISDFGAKTIELIYRQFLYVNRIICTVENCHVNVSF